MFLIEKPSTLVSFQSKISKIFSLSKCILKIVCLFQYIFKGKKKCWGVNCPKIKFTLVDQTPNSEVFFFFT